MVQIEILNKYIFKFSSGVFISGAFHVSALSHYCSRKNLSLKTLMFTKIPRRIISDQRPPGVGVSTFLSLFEESTSSFPDKTFNKSIWLQSNLRI